MRADIAEQWATALESGEYEQGRGFLKQSKIGMDRYCCKGVLCDLAIKAGVEMQVSPVDDGSEVVHFDGDWQLLPPKVVEWAGIRRGDTPFVRISDDGRGLRDIKYKYLWELNDEEQWEFSRIAALIREQAADI